VFIEDSLKMILRVYVDGSAVPQVEAPLGPMFGFYFANDDKWGSPYGADNSLFQVSENGAMTLLAPMPFKNGIRISLSWLDPNVKMRVWTQTSYFQFTPECPLTDPYRFWARFRTEDRQQEESRLYHVGHTMGRGHLLGFTFGLEHRDMHDSWFHNGADMIILDHYTNPRVMKGTGGEDFFGTSCWFHEHHNFPEWGFISGNEQKFSSYRFFLDAFRLPFSSSFSFDYGANHDIVSSVMYWYQDSDHKPLVMSHLHPHVDSWTVSSPFSWNDNLNATLSEFPPPFSGVNISALFGFISIGQYYFRYPTNEGYPVNVAVYARSDFEVSEPIPLLLKVTHDDPISLWLNGHLIYHALNPTFTHHTHTVHIPKDQLMSGFNALHAVITNLENMNTRAWVIGVTFEPHSFVPPKGELLRIDGRCE
jgi:hypothetical protein